MASPFGSAATAPRSSSRCGARCSCTSATSTRSTPVSRSAARRRSPTRATPPPEVCASSIRESPRHGRCASPVTGSAMRGASTSPRRSPLCSTPSDGWACRCRRSGRSRRTWRACSRTTTGSPGSGNPCRTTWTASSTRSTGWTSSAPSVSSPAPRGSRWRTSFPPRRRRPSSSESTCRSAGPVRSRPSRV